MPGREDLLERLRIARQEIMNLLPEAEKYRDSNIYPDWTLKEMLSHMTGWDDVMITSVQAYLSGDEPGTPADRGIDDYNARTVKNRITQDFEQVRKEWKQARETFISIVQEMPANIFQQSLLLPWREQGTISYALEIFIHHEHSHARDLAEWLKNPDQPLTGRH